MTSSILQIVGAILGTIAAIWINNIIKQYMQRAEDSDQKRESEETKKKTDEDLRRIQDDFDRIKDKK